MTKEIDYRKLSKLEWVEQVKRDKEVALKRLNNWLEAENVAIIDIQRSVILGHPRNCSGIEITIRRLHDKRILFYLPCTVKDGITDINKQALDKILREYTVISFGGVNVKGDFYDFLDFKIESFDYIDFRYIYPEIHGIYNEIDQLYSFMSLHQASFEEKVNRIPSASTSDNTDIIAELFGAIGRNYNE